MRGLRTILHVVLTLTLLVNAYAAAAAQVPMQGAASMDGADSAHAGHGAPMEQAPPCHGDTGGSSAPAPADQPVPGCCLVDACVCSIAGTFVAAFGVTLAGSVPPEHALSQGELEQGHSPPTPNLLLRPPNR